MTDLNIDNNIDKLVTIAMAKSDGVMVRAAALLGISESSMSRLIRRRMKNDTVAKFGSGRKTDGC